MLRRVGLGMLGLAGVLFVIIILANIFAGEPDQKKGGGQVAAQERAGQEKGFDKKKDEADSPPEHWQKIDKSEEMQQKRKDFIRDLKEKDVIDHIDPSQGLLEIYIGPTWHRIKFDKKETFIDAAVTYYYAQDPEMRFAVIKDPYTDKEIGTFNQYGLNIN